MLGQLLLGLVNGSFYALLSLGLAVIFGFARHRQFRARRAVHDGRVRRVDPARSLRPELLVGARDLAIDHRRARRRHRAPVPQAALPARSGLWTAADVRSRADRRRHLPRNLRRIGPAVQRARGAAGRHESRLHGASELSWMGRRRIVDDLLRDVVPHRENASRFDVARGDRERGARPVVRRQRSGDGDADLRCGSGTGRARGGPWPRRSSRSTR